MSIPVDVADLGRTLADFDAGYLLTTSDARVKAVSIAPELADGVLVARAPGRGSCANVKTNPQVTALFPPRVAPGFSLLVDGTAEVDGDDVRLTPTSAVLHKPVGGAAGGAAVSPSWVTAFLDLADDDFRAGVVFWGEVTGYGVSAPRGEGGEFATLVPRRGAAFLRVQKLDTGPTRIHLDLHVSDPRAAAEAAVFLGARVVHLSKHGYVVMSSPAGFPFCFVSGQADTRPEPATWPGGRSIVDQVCLDIPPSAYDVETAFWRDLTGWELDRSAATPHLGHLRRQPGQPLRLLLQRLDDERPMAAHLDLAAEDRAAETERHLALGARLVRHEERWTVLTDPAGSAYCITDRDPGTGLLP